MQNLSEPLRVRIHLNLGRPEQAENTIKVRSPKSGRWITLAYADQLRLKNVEPVVHLAAQKRIAKTGGRKSPHAFLEGDLISFQGRMREKRPRGFDALADDLLARMDRSRKLSTAFNTVAINYNPRFANCFYADNQDKSEINERFVRADNLYAIGWRFCVEGGEFAPFEKGNRNKNYQKSLAQTSAFERRALEKVARKFSA